MDSREDSFILCDPPNSPLIGWQRIDLLVVGERRREGWAVMQNDERVRPIFLGIAANGALRWNEAKGRVSGGNFYVMVRIRKICEAPPSWRRYVIDC